MANIGSLIQKEFNRLKTDKRTLFLIFAIPAILIFVFGLCSGGGPQSFFTVAVISEDELPQSSIYINGTLMNNTAEYDDLFISTIENNCSSFGLYSYFNITTITDSESVYNQSFALLENESIDAVIILPANFSESILNNSSPLIRFYADGSDVNVKETLYTALQEPIGLFKFQSYTLQNFTIAFPSFEYDVPFWKSQVLNYAVAIILPLIIIGTTMNMTSLSIVSEAPLPRLALTPSGKRDFVLSKLFAYSLIMLIQVIEIFFIINLFGLYIRGTENMFQFFMVMFLSGLSGVSIGLAISGVSKNSQQANQLFIMGFIVIVLFSNTFIPLSLLPAQMQNLANLLPLSYAVPLFMDIQLRGVVTNDMQYISLTFLSFLYTFVAYIAFRMKKIEV